MSAEAAARPRPAIRLRSAVDQREQRIRRRHGLRRARLDPLGEEIQPALPVSAQAHLVQQLVVERAMRLEEQARIQHRLAQHPVGYQLQHDQQPPEAPIAVEKGMNRLELHVGQRRLDER